MSLSPPSTWSSTHPHAPAVGGAAAASHFCPPLLIVQLFLERISSPWESNFNCKMPVQIRFVPISSSPPASVLSLSAAAADGQLRVGQGRLFIVRHDQIGCLQLDIAGEDNRMTSKWRGQIRLVEKEGPSSQTSSAALTMCRQMECELRSIGDEAVGAGLVLTAHLLISVDGLGRKRERRRGKKDNGEAREQRDDQRQKRENGESMTKKNMEDAWAQTEEERNEKREEIGVQTVTEVGEVVSTEKQKSGQTLRRATSARMIMLIMMALMRRSGVGRETADQQLIERDDDGRGGTTGGIGGKGQLIGKVIGRNGGLLGRDILIERVIRRDGRHTMISRVSGRQETRKSGRDGQVIRESGRKGIETRESETMTHLSIDPSANGTKMRIHPNQIALINNYRARIAYLSTVHRSMAQIEEKRVRQKIRGEGKRDKEGRESAVMRERQRNERKSIMTNKEQLMEFGKEKAENNGRESSNGLQSVAASSESEETLLISGRMRKTPEGVNGRVMPEEIKERREMPRGMNGRDKVLAEGIIGKMRKTPEGTDGRKMVEDGMINGRTIAADDKSSSSTVPNASSSPSHSSSSHNTKQYSSAKRSSQSSASSSSSSTVTSSTNSTVTSSTPTKSSISAASADQKSSNSSAASSSSLKGSSAKTESSIATEMSKNDNANSSDRQSNSSVPTERKLSDQSKQSESPTTEYLNRLRKQVLDDL